MEQARKDAAEKEQEWLREKQWEQQQQMETQERSLKENNAQLSKKLERETDNDLRVQTRILEHKLNQCKPGRTHNSWGPLPWHIRKQWVKAKAKWKREALLPFIAFDPLKVLYPGFPRGLSVVLHTETWRVQDDLGPFKSLENINNLTKVPYWWDSRIISQSPN